jgi:ABC-type multidrug transport system ATPase subunit
LDWESEEAKDHVHAIVHLLGLGSHAEKSATELLGGYKRRLSLAIAMLGYPTSVLIDECTTGVDPEARHLIWGVLQPDMAHETYDLPAIRLSTHYMDEAAALASRIGIMIDGQLATTGSLYRLQERHCISYFVEIALQQAAPSKSEGKIIGVFQWQGMDATVYEPLAYTINIRVPFVETGGYHSTTHQLAAILGLLENKKEELHIKLYSVVQMNLEQIFINLARQQSKVEELFRELTTSARSL